MMGERVGEKGERIGECRLFGKCGQFPQAAPACAGLLFEQDAAAFHDPGAVFAECEGLGAWLLDWEQFGIDRAALLAHGAAQALRFGHSLVQHPSFHQKLTIFLQQILGFLNVTKWSWILESTRRAVIHICMK